MMFKLILIEMLPMLSGEGRQVLDLGLERLVTLGAITQEDLADLDPALTALGTAMLAIAERKLRA